VSLQILILFGISYLFSQQAVLCGIVIVIHQPLNWCNHCGRFSFPLRRMHWTCWM